MVKGIKDSAQQNLFSISLKFESYFRLNKPSFKYVLELIEPPLKKRDEINVRSKHNKIGSNIAFFGPGIVPAQPLRNPLASDGFFSSSCTSFSNWHLVVILIFSIISTKIYKNTTQMQKNYTQAIQDNT